MAGELSGWNLSGQDLTGAMVGLTGTTDITGAKVAQANFSDETYFGFTAAQLYSTASYQSGDLHGIILDTNNLSNWNFDGQNLTGASLQAVITGASFVNANLSHAKFDNGWASGANFTSANLTSASFGGTDVTGAIFRNANLSGAGFGNATVTSADFTGAVITGAAFTGITATQIYSTSSYAAHDLHDISLSTDMSGWNLANQNLSGARLDSSPNAFIGTDFTDAIITGAFFDQGTLSLTQLYSTQSYKVHDLHGIYIFNPVQFSGADFSGQNLSGTTLSGDLTDASFANADLTNARMGDVTGADFNDARITGSDLVKITLAQIQTTASYKNHDLHGVWFPSEIDLYGSDFTDFNLEGANMRVNLAGVDFSNANITGASVQAISLTQLYSTASYHQKNLSGMKFYKSDLGGGNFDDQDLRDASFSDGNLISAQFVGADLRGTQFNNETLTSSSFVGACLIGTQFDTPPTGCDFTLADLRGTYELEAFPDAVLRNTIPPDGMMYAMNLLAGDKMTVHDGIIPIDSYSHETIPIVIDHELSLASGAVLDLVFDGTTWGSAIELNPNAIVDLSGGTLVLSFDRGVNPGSLAPVTFKVFDWPGDLPEPSEFGAIDDSLPPGMFWDLSKLYTDGTITLVPEPAEFGMMAALVVICWRRRKGRE